LLALARNLIAILAPQQHLRFDVYRLAEFCQLQLKGFQSGY
jgi:hypothetical protein